MPQLTPFFFINQLSFLFLSLVILTYIISKYILPNFLYLKTIRLFLSKLGSTSKKTFR